MTPSELEERVRNRYNSIGDSFWSQDEIFGLITDAQTQAARECLLIERTFTTTTTAGVQEYSFPTNAIAIKRVTWNGQRVDPIDMIEDDALTGMNTGNVAEGTPTVYFQWNYTISLRPLPGSAETLKIWAYCTASEVEANSSLEIPEQFHSDMLNYVLMEMLMKDKNYTGASKYEERWEKSMLRMKAWAKKRKRADGFAVVKSEEMIPRGL